MLVEAAVVGREVECGVLEDADGRPEASVPAEIRLVGGHDWYDFEAKYLDDACEFDLPPDLPAAVIADVQDAACRAFDALDCAGLARVDFFVTPDHRVIVNEVNTMPGFTPVSMFPRMWAASGVDYPRARRPAASRPPCAAAPPEAQRTRVCSNRSASASGRRSARCVPARAARRCCAAR